MHQIKLDLKNNSAILGLNSFFYPKHILQRSALEFAKLAKISLREENGRIVVNINPKGNEKAGETALHFCNFALSLKQELGQHA